MLTLIVVNLKKDDKKDLETVTEAYPYLISFLGKCYQLGLKKCCI